MSCSRPDAAQYLSLDLNLEEAAARGAAALAASLMGYDDSNAEDLMTFDVVNAAFGLETVGGELVSPTTSKHMHWHSSEPWPTR